MVPHKQGENTASAEIHHATLGTLIKYSTQVTYYKAIPAVSLSFKSFSLQIDAENRVYSFKLIRRDN